MIDSKTHCPDCLEPWDKCVCGGKRSKSDNSLPPYPKVCGVSGCDGDTAVNSAVIKDDNKTFIAIPFSKYGYEKGKSYYLYPGYEFVEHYPRCCDCHTREQHTMRHVSDPVSAHMTKLKQTNPELFYKPESEEDRLAYHDMCRNFIYKQLSRVVLKRRKREYTHEESEDGIKVMA